MRRQKALDAQGELAKDDLLACPELVGQQRVVIELLVEGLDPAQSAKRLGISRRTVENHRRLAFAKLGTNKASVAGSIFLRAKMQLLKQENTRLRNELAALLPPSGAHRHFNRNLTLVQCSRKELHQLRGLTRQR